MSMDQFYFNLVTLVNDFMQFFSFYADRLMWNTSRAAVSSPIDDYG